MTDLLISANDKSRLYAEQRKQHWNAVAGQPEAKSIFSRYYHQHLIRIYQKQVPAGSRILELGCGQGDLLAALQPELGVGIDFSETMVQAAAARHPQLTFLCADVHNLSMLQGHFDVILLSDLLNDLWDIQGVFQQVAPLCHTGTRILMNFYSRMWQPLLILARKIRLATPTLPQNWLTQEDVVNLLALADFEVIRAWQEILLPFPIPLLSGFLNRFLVRFWPFHLLACTNILVARPRPEPVRAPHLVSVVVPARNEAGNIASIFTRVPEMGLGTELIFIEGGSKDDTFARIEQERKLHPERKILLHKQSGSGKGQAVRQGFVEASGDVLMILDADLTVLPESLPLFYEALVRGKGEFINGVRLVYPMEKEAMRFFNFLGNKFFSLAFSWLLGQPIKDTLCGTKVLWKADYKRISANRSYFGDFDPFGDFDLIFGAARLNLKIVDLPVRYQDRTYGDTNISRWKHGWLLMKMVLFAARKIKFS